MGKAFRVYGRSPGMKAKYINPFLSASINLFKDYLGIIIKDKKPFVSENPLALDEISAIIGLAGETRGAIVLTFSRETAIKMISRFAGRPFIGITNDVLDGVGELTNILAGNAKKDLLDFKIDISLPGVVTGKNSHVNWPKGIPIITIPFESEFGDFALNVSLMDII
jgi:chemotaxis protein CheX